MISAGGIAAAVIVAFVVHRLLFAALGRVLRGTETPVDDRLLRDVRRPALLILVVLAVRVVLPSLELPPRLAETVEHGVGIAVIVAVAWLTAIVLRVSEWLIVRRYDVTVADNLKARRIHTQVRIIRRCLVVVVVVVAIAAVLMTFPRMRQLGASLLASAGIAGLIVGLAARPAVENLIAGLQVAFAEPIRLDDVVIISGEWGRIEEIRTTFVVVRIWDERRLIVPFSKFLHEPFENWTRTSADILGTVTLHADYRVPVEAVREELTRIARSSDLWDGRVCKLQITDATTNTVVLRALVSSADASKNWELRCLVRERLLAYLQERHVDALPRVRAEVGRMRGPT